MTEQPTGAARALTSPSARPAWLVVGSALTTLLIATAGLHIGHWTLGSEQRTDHRVYAGTIRTLSLRTASGDVVIRPKQAAPGDDDGSVVVDARRVGSIVLPTVREQRDGDRLELEGRCGVPFDWLSGCRMSFVVQVPPGLRLRVDTGSGDIELGAVRYDEVAADSRSGELRATGSTGGRATLRTASGSIMLTDVDAASADVRTGSGRIDGLGLRVADLVLDTGSGAITTGLAAAPARLDARTGSGRVTVQVPPGDPYDVDVDTGSGESRVGVRHDSDAPRSLRVRTGSGDVDLTYSNS